jgi:hypothetical protein
METNVTASSAGGQNADYELLQEMQDRQRKTPGSYKTQPTPQARKKADWEAIGLKGIAAKRLNLDVGWSSATWTNKTKKEERLKLLKDEGVDISELLRVVKTADGNKAITEAVVAQVAVRKTRPRSLQPAPQVAPPVSGNTEEVQEAPFDPLFDEPDTPPTNKRKRDDTPVKKSPETETSNPNETVDQGPPSFKKLCTASLRDANKDDTMPAVKEEDMPDWNELKSKVLRDIFQPLQEARKHDPARATAPVSRIIIKFPSLDDTVPPSSLELIETGYASIKEELDVLSDSTDEDGTIHILAPAVANATRHSIKVITSIRHRTLLEGNLAALMGLLKRLSTKNVPLLHKEKSDFDTAGVRKYRGSTYELSDKTQQQLEDITAALEKGWEMGEAVAVVSWKGKDIYRKKEEEY